ncbi:CPBP family intramembrane glutamic endopeptidase [Paenibacillus sp. 1001270B_150601_E10]|uniref:CPBP family intramembrane glutamic endopeptidase n=1 Tax=Paenibacillus sp. 1001270B_150601_E10 TaxID=2787079 RepID=UPI0018A023AA|nr:CPBP family intramembrane glutamic endopeptidase [Paenibacillus sp. 1001270B_150601_E10]
MMMTLLIAILLTFSYKITEYLVHISPLNKYKAYSVYLWGLVVVLLFIFMKNSLVYTLPNHLLEIAPAFFIIGGLNFVIARYSGYHPIGRYHTLNFMFTYPILEELLFRGMILPLLNQAFPSASSMTVLWLPMTTSVMITAALFAICHLQYYKLSKQSAGYMLFAFAGGMIFGGMTEAAGSIWPAVLLHIQFNAMCVYYSRKNHRKMKV